MDGSLNSSEQTRFNLDKALKLLGLSPEQEARIKQAPRELHAELLLARDDGSYTLIPAWRLQQTGSGTGPCLGPLRISPTLSAHELQTLAQFSGWQSALLNLPFAGAAGGIACEPDDFSSAERQRLLKTYAETFADVLGPQQDVPVLEPESDAREAASLLAALSLRHGSVPAAVCGKPRALGGLPEGEHAAALGLFRMLNVAQDHQQLPLSQSRYVIQGFGPMARELARLLHEAGAVVLAVSDAQGAIRAHSASDQSGSAGLDVPAVIKTARSFGSCTRHDGVEMISTDELLALDCDVLVLTGPGQILDVHHADRVKAALIAEAAPLALSPEALTVMLALGRHVLPALLGLAGAHLAHALEWAEPLPGLQSGLITSRFDQVLPGLYEQVLSTANRHQTDLSTSALALALEHRLL